MDVLLVSPYFKEGLKGFPLGLAYIAEAIRGNHNVYVIDLTARAQLERRDPYDIFGEELSRIEPDVVGVTSTSPTHLPSIAVARNAKDMLGSEVTVVKGGPHEAYCSRTTLELHPEIDISVIGEGEETTKELINALNSDHHLGRIHGIAYREGENIRVTPKRQLILNLDALPLPARDLFYSDDKLEKYYSASIFSGKKSTSIITSRGCPYPCSFCSSRAMWGRLRQRSVENVMNEMAILYDDGFEGFVFEDDMSIANRGWFLRFADSIKYSEMPIQYSLQTRVDAVDDYIAKALSDSGCVFMYFGVESGIQDILDRCKKGVTIEQTKNAFAAAKRYGIRSMASVQFGLPGEDLNDLTTVRETIRILNEEIMPDDVAVSYTSLYPGSPLAEEAGVTPEAYEELIETAIDNEITSKIAHGARSMHPEGLTDDKILEIEEMLASELQVNRFDPAELYPK